MRQGCWPQVQGSSAILATTERIICGWVGLQEAAGERPPDSAIRAAPGLESSHSP